MDDVELRDEMSERVAEAVRHALAVVGPAESATQERVAETDQAVS